MADLLFALDKVLPVFLLILLGRLAAARNLVSAAWSQGSSALVFRFSLPVLIFESIYGADLGRAFAPGLYLFSLGATLVSAAGAWILGVLLVRERPSRGSFIQGAFRGNFVILALPIIGAVFGDEGRAQASILVTGVMPLYNILAVLVLTLHGGGGRRRGAGAILRDIATNPLILGAAAAIPFSLTGLRLPSFLEGLVSYLGDLAVPLALLDLGASMAGRKAAAPSRALLAATLHKIVLIPAAFAAAAWLLGFRGRELGVLFMLGAAPTAVSSYVMAKSMDNDAALAGDIVLLTTLGSAFSIVAGLWLLRGLGLL